MPVMNGYQLCENIRSMGSDVPILGVSAATVGTEVDQLIEAGANIALPKPITKEGLLKAWAALA
jgi:two-component system capsular synthesis sensor histidine kinase RcsC